MPNIALPDGKVVAFPDDMPKEEIRALIEHKFPDAAAKMGNAAPKPFDTTGLAMPGTTPPPGAPPIGVVPPSQHFGLGSSDTLNPIPAISAGTDTMVGNLPGGNMLQGLRDKANASLTGTTPEQSRASMDEAVKQNPEAATIGAVAGKVAPYVAAGAIGGPVAAALGLEGSLGSKLVMGGLSSEAINYGDERAHGKDPLTAGIDATKTTLAELPFYILGPEGKKADTVKAAPTVEAIKAQAQPLYDAAEKSGLVISQPFVQRMVDSATSSVMKRGLDETLTPKAVAAVKRLQSVAGRNMSIQDAMTVRKVLGNAATKSLDTNATDHALATTLLHDFNGFLEDISKPHPQGLQNAAVLSGNAAEAHSNLVAANALWSRASKGQMLDTAIASAVDKAATRDMPLDKALRGEFGSIHQSIIKGELPGFTAKEISSIKDVAHGSGAQKLARTVGRLRSGGIGGVTGAAASGGWAGHLASGGNPVAAALGAGVGGTTAALSGAIGAMGRGSARRITSRDAQLASATARGPALGNASGNALQPSRFVRALPGNVGRAGTVVALSDLMRQRQPANAQ